MKLITEKLLDSDAIIGAIVCTFQKYENDGRKPGSEQWVHSRHDRSSLLAEIVIAWSQLLDIEEFWNFPYSDEFVLSLWVKCRKMGRSEREKLIQGFAIKKG